MLGFALTFGRTYFHTEPAAGAVFRGDLQCVPQAFEFTPAGLRGFESGGGSPQFAGVIYLGANDCMGAYEYAFTALDAQFLVPNWNLLRNISFFPLGCSCRKCSIDRHRTDWKGIA